MRVRLIVDAEGPNPLFDPSKPKGPGNLRSRILPKGTEIEDPEAFFLCRPDYQGITRAEPVDDEAKALHESWEAKYRLADGSRAKTISEQRAALEAAEAGAATL